MELEEGQVEVDDCSACVTQDSSEAVKHSATMFIFNAAEKHKLPLSATSSLLVVVFSLIAVCSQEDNNYKSFSGTGVHLYTCRRNTFVKIWDCL